MRPPVGVVGAANEAQPLKDHEVGFGDPSAFLEGAYRSVFLAYVPD